MSWSEANARGKTVTSQWRNTAAPLLSTWARLPPPGSQTGSCALRVCWTGTRRVRSPCQRCPDSAQSREHKTNWVRSYHRLGQQRLKGQITKGRMRRKYCHGMEDHEEKWVTHTVSDSGLDPGGETGIEKVASELCSGSAAQWAALSRHRLPGSVFCITAL